MGRTPVVRIGVGVVLAGMAIGGFFLFIPVQQPNPSRLAALAVTGHGVHAGTARGSVKPAASSELDAVRQAASASPGETGSYQVSWNKSPGVAGASLDLFVLPSASDAQATRRAAVATRLGQTSQTAKGFGFAGTLHLGGLPGVAATSYISGTSPTVTADVPHLDLAVFQVAHVVVVAEAGGATAGKARAALAKLVRAERTHLLRAGAVPALAETSVPALAAAVYLVAAAIVIAAVEASPAGLAAARARREAVREEELRRERASRGRKVVKRRGGPVMAGRGHTRR